MLLSGNIVAERSEKMMMADHMAYRKHTSDRNDIDLSPPAAWERQFDGAPRGSYRDRSHKRQMTQLAAAVAVYLVLLAGLTLHGLAVPDPTSSLSSETTAVPAMHEYRRDRE